MSVTKDRRYVPIVDSGWGWIVVVGSFFIHVFADGIVYSFGILLEVIMREFDATNAKASIVISLLTGLTLGFGPVASAVTNKFGCRFTTILGAIIASIGCAASYYATSVEYLMVSVGCIMGIGFGLIYCPTIIVVTMYFEKKRALATGITVCGAGIGAVLFAPISNALITAFSWRVVFIYYTAVILLCILCGASFRPLKFVEVNDETDAANDFSENLAKGPESKNHEDKTKNDSMFIKNAVKNETERRMLLSNIKSESQSEIDNRGLERSVRRILSLDNVKRQTFSEATGYINVKDVFLTVSVSAIPDFGEKFDRYRSITSLHITTDAKGKNFDTFLEIESAEDEANKTRGMWRTFVKMTDMSLLLEPIFLLYALSNLLTSIAFNSPLVFLPSHAVNLGCTDQQAAQIVSAFGFLNTVGRILIGLISDRQLPVRFGKDTGRNRLWIYSVSLSICGILTILVFVCQGFHSLTIYSGLFGLTLSSYVCLTSVVLVDLIGIERLTNAFGLILLFQGLGTVVGPPTAGRLADMTGSYDISFVFCGISLLTSGLMMFLIAMLRRAPVKTAMEQ